MVSPGEVAGVVLLLLINVILAAVTTRFTRLLTETRSGTVVGLLLTVPLVLLASTLLLSGGLSLGVDVQDRMIVVMLAIGLPFALGLTIDYLWVASPTEVEDELNG